MLTSLVSPEQLKMRVPEVFEARLDVPAGETAQAQPAVPERKAP